MGAPPNNYALADVRMTMNQPRWLRAFSHLKRLPEVARCTLGFRHSAAVIARYLRLCEGEYPYELNTRHGHSLRMLSFHDIVTAWVIFCREEYALPASVKTILDVGANYGAFSIWASERAPASRSVAVEPFPDCFARLQHHIQINDLTDRITAWETGLGQHSQDRFVSLLGCEQAGDPSQSRAFVGEILQQADSVKVPVLSMTDLVTNACTTLGCDEIDFMKLDVEGIEHVAIVPEAVNALRRIRNLSLEYHPNGSKAALFEVLATAGLFCAADLPFHENSGVAQFAREVPKPANRAPLL